MSPLAPRPFPAVAPEPRTAEILWELHTRDAPDYWPIIRALPEFDAQASERARGCRFPAWFALTSGELVVRDGTLVQWVVLDQTEWARAHPDRRDLLPRYAKIN